MLALLIEQVSDYAIFLLDPTGNVASWNPGAQKIKGYRAEEIIGRHFSKFYPPETRTRDWPQQELELAQRYGRFEDEGWRLRKDGSRFWANVVITPLRDASGTLTGFAKITRDLTERRSQEERLQRSEARCRLLIEGVKDSAILSLSAAGLVETWNAGAQRIFGYASHEIIGRDSECFFLPDDLLRGAPYRELEEAAHERAEREGWRVRRDGTRFWAHVITTPEYGRDGTLSGYTQVLRDMTESRHIDALEEAGRRTNEFIAMLAHELRNPLAPIRNAVAVMQTGDGPPPAMEPWLRIVDRQTALLSRLLDDLLDASRVANGKITVQRQRVDLRSVLARALEASRPLIDAHRHQLEVSIPPEPLHCDGDAARLCQVFANLLDNAAKFTLDGGKISLSVKRADGHAVVRVRDNGIGMSPAMRERAFDLFVQGERELDRAGGGLGVGLPLARRVFGVRAVVRGQRLGDLGQPFVELRGRARVQRRHRAHHAGLALGDHELGLLMMNSGDPMTGKRRFFRTGGRVRAGAVMARVRVRSGWGQPDDAQSPRRALSWFPPGAGGGGGGQRREPDRGLSAASSLPLGTKLTPWCTR